MTLVRATTIGAALVAALLVPGVAVAAPAPAAGQQPPSTTAPQTRTLSTLGEASRYAFVETPVSVHTAPSQSARTVGELGIDTFWNTSQIVLVLQGTVTGEAWLDVRMPSPRDDVTGWVPASSLSSLHVVDTWLKIDREHLTATLIRDGKSIFSAEVGVGKPSTPTPTGQYFIEESLTPTETNGLYGPLAFGTSARSDVLTEWPNGGQIGVHGTDEPQLIPGRISHGCVRLRNADILTLGRLMPVGTPLTIY